MARGHLLTSTNSEPPAHFHALEKGYPEEGTITVIVDTDTNLDGRSGALKGEEGPEGGSKERVQVGWKNNYEQPGHLQTLGGKDTRRMAQKV